MSAVVAFYTVAILAAVLMVGGFILWKFRFVIRSGYFRAEIICESGRVIHKTMRLKGASEFSLIVEGVRDIYHIHDGRSETIEKKDGQKETLRYPNRIYPDGRMRVPKSYYNAHQAEPIDMQALRKQSTVSATKYSELARNTVTSGLFMAFDELSIREQIIQLMMILIPVAAVVLGVYFLNSRLETIIDKLGG